MSQGISPPLKSAVLNGARLSRRQSLQMGAATTAAGLLAAQQWMPAAEAKDPPEFRATPFVDALPVYSPKPAEAFLSPTPTPAANTGGGECGRLTNTRYAEWAPQKYYTIRAKVGLHKFHRDMPDNVIWGYDGTYPGPTIVGRYGVPSVVRIYNDLPANAQGYGSPEISTHLHNLHCGSESDGFTDDWYSPTKFGETLTGPGAYKDHHYPHCYAGYDDPRYRATNGDPREALGTLWYHDHRVDFTAGNVSRGLAGFYLMFDEIDSGNELDPNPAALRLPSGVGRYDIPLLFQDKTFDASGYTVYDQFATKGVIGNKFCVNGKIQPYFQVERRKYRFRLLDGGPSRFYEFYLATSAGVNQPFTYIANDGNLLPAPLATSKVAIGVAERADIVIDFSKYPVGTQLFIVNRLFQKDGRGPEDSEFNPRDANGFLTNTGTQILRFDITRDPASPDMSQVPALLRELPPINMAEVVKTRTFEFTKDNEVWTVNNKIYDGHTPVATVKRGTAEIWTFKGKGNWHHPVHVHFEEGRILSRNGKPPPPHELGRKDVYVLAPGEEIKVFMRFRDFTGKYMMHCHNTVHEDKAMMIRWDVEA